MKLITIYLILLCSVVARADEFESVERLFNKNGVQPSKRVVVAILRASHAYDINPLDLAAIGLIENATLNPNAIRVNKNSTLDLGLFQINTINHSECREYNIMTVEGSAFCAAKILSRIRSNYGDDDPQWLGRYHSGTPSKKKNYVKKIITKLARVE